jgi:hypothetical protein
VDGAQPSIIMKADPRVGDSYRQEYYAGEAEDMGAVVDLNQSVSVPYGDFDDCLQTLDRSALDLDIMEYKYCSPGVGYVPESLESLSEPISAGYHSLGLSLVKAIALSHGGQVSVSSDPGRGSTFTVTLPASSRKL